LYAKSSRNWVKFVKFEAFNTPCVGQRFKGNIETDLVSEAKTVSDGASEAVDPNDLAIYSMLFGPQFQQGCGDLGRPPEAVDNGATVGGARRRAGGRVRLIRSARPTLRAVLDDAVESVQRVARADFWRAARAGEHLEEAPFAVTNGSALKASLRAAG
jgi:hypothetical protein